MRLRTLNWIALFIFVSLACRAMLPGGEDEPGRILFRDDFSDPSSGWNRVTAANGETNYADGAYRVFVNEPDMDIWAIPGLDFTDARIEVDTLKVGGDRNNRFGVICRVSEPNTFYTFVISSDGFYGIGKIKGDVYQLIGMDALQPAEAILKGSALNHIRADCVGNVLTLHVNGQKLAEVQDGEFISGDVGLIAGTYDVPGVDIRFDNFVVYQP